MKSFICKPKIKPLTKETVLDETRMLSRQIIGHNKLYTEDMWCRLPDHEKDQALRAQKHENFIMKNMKSFMRVKIEAMAPKKRRKIVEILAQARPLGPPIQIKS